MTTVDCNRDRVLSLREDLQDRYRSVSVEEETRELDPDEFAEAVENAREGYDGGAYAWVVRHPEDAAAFTDSFLGEWDDRKRALLLLPRAGDEWGLPGGGREGEETFEDAAVREVREETGVDCEITGLWHLRHVEWVSTADGDDRRTNSLHVFFDARYTGGHVAIQAGEVNGAAWFAALPERLLPATERRAADWDPEN